MVCKKANSLGTRLVLLIIPTDVVIPTINALHLNLLIIISNQRFKQTKDKHHKYVLVFTDIYMISLIYTYSLKYIYIYIYIYIHSKKGSRFQMANLLIKFLKRDLAGLNCSIWKIKWIMKLSNYQIYTTSVGVIVT